MALAPPASRTREGGPAAPKRASASTDGPTAPERASARRGGLIVAAGVAVIIAAGVYANFTSLKYPNDGVYYVAGARALLESGQLVDATVVPPGPPITRQNGVVYVLAGLMAAGGRGWPAAYAVMIAMLWTGAILAMARFYGDLRGERIGGFVAAGMTFLQYDLLNDSTSFMNEGVYAPACFLIAATAGRALIGVKSRAEVPAAFARLPRWFPPAAAAFIVLGLFFRNQHVVLLPLVLIGFALAGRTLWGITLAGLAVGSFAVYAAGLPAPITDAYLATTLALQSVDASDAAYGLAMFTGPLSLTKVLPYGHPVVVATGIVLAAAAVAGLRKLFRYHPLLAAALALYIAGTLLFLVMLPFVSTRYYGLVNLPLVATFAVLVPRGRRAYATAGAAAVTVLAVLAWYASDYLSGRKAEQAFPQLRAHRHAIPETAGALVYSSQPRMVAWVLGAPACVAVPAECAAARRVGPGRVVFIGRADELEGQTALAGYRIDRPLTVPSGGYAAWAMSEAP